MILAATCLAIILCIGYAAAADYNLKGEEGQTLEGNIASILPADLVRPNAKVVISVENGQNVTFEVKPLAVIYNGADGRIMSLTELTVGQMVKINYTAKGGSMQITAIKVPASARDTGVSEQPEQVK